MGFLRKNPAPAKRELKKLFGIESKQHLHSDWRVLRGIGPVSDRHIVVDAGSHHGWFYHCWKDWCPAAEIHAFEPNLDAFEVARGLYGGTENRIFLSNIALGRSEQVAEYFIYSDNDISSSMLQPNRETWERIAYETGDLEQRETRVTSLDQYVASLGIENIYLMKIDVQGYELEVLEGARRTLPQIAHVFVEAGIERLYKNAPRFSDVASFLLDHDFHLMNMRAWHRGNNRLVETDMLFRRNGLEGAIDKSKDRHVMNLIEQKV